MKNRIVIFLVVIFVLGVSIHAYAQNPEPAKPQEKVSIEGRKAKIISLIDERIKMLQEQKTCVSTAKTPDDLTRCREKVREERKEFNVELDLIEYHAFEDGKGEHGIICTEIDYGEVVDPPYIPTLEEKLAYFQDKKIRDLFEAVIDELQAKKIEIKPIHGLWISFWYKGKRFMYMSPERNLFVAEVLTPEGNWTGQKGISDRKEWDGLFEEHIQKYIQYLDKEW